MSPLPRLGRFCFLRHGESESNVLGVVAGWTDVALTDRGRVQAAEMAERLAGAGITAIHASTLTRARDTAEIIGARLGLPVTTDAALAERNWGALEGHPPERSNYTVAPPGGESLEVFVARLMAGLARAAPPGDGLPLVVSHSGAFRAIRELLLAGDPRHRITNREPLLLTPEAGGTCWRVEVL